MTSIFTLMAIFETRLVSHECYFHDDRSIAEKGRKFLLKAH